MAIKIVILDDGFVYIGNVSEQLDHLSCLEISNAWNIRLWGTTMGLGQLALHGMTKNTVLDRVGTIRPPFARVNHLMEVNEPVWEKQLRSLKQ